MIEANVLAKHKMLGGLPRFNPDKQEEVLHDLSSRPMVMGRREVTCPKPSSTASTTMSSVQAPATPVSTLAYADGMAPYAPISRKRMGVSSVA